MLIPYLLWWIRLWYRIGHGLTYWLLRLIPMPQLVRHQRTGAVALVPYLWVVWGFIVAFDFTWRADVIAGALTVAMLLLLLMYRVEVGRAGIQR
ncbi:hypothetical protein [Kocuria sabuli]|uniref:hypothetical protein n=1 Tax=Kocuria sabuli TaxID=3071448 RepID=UPI0034D445BC